VPPADAELLWLLLLWLLWEACVPLPLFEKCEHETVRASSTTATAVPNSFAIIALLLW